MTPRVGWIAGTVLAIVAVVLGGPAPAPTGAPLQRLLGPFADLAADVQWIRYQHARRAGRLDLAFVRAESALALAPHATDGWDLFASHLGLFLASPEREPDPARRLAWVESALAVARRGETVADDPALLASLRAYILLAKTETDPELPWPGGVDGMVDEAARAFERAAELGDPFAGELARELRER